MSDGDVSGSIVDVVLCVQPVVISQGLTLSSHSSKYWSARQKTHEARPSNKPRGKEERLRVL